MKYISINRHAIRRNIKQEEREPPISIRTSKSGKPVYANEIAIEGPSTLIYSPDEPILACGARLVITTEANVRILK